LERAIAGIDVVFHLTAIRPRSVRKSRAWRSPCWQMIRSMCWQLPLPRRSRKGPQLLRPLSMAWPTSSPPRGSASPLAQRDAVRSRHGLYFREGCEGSQCTSIAQAPPPAQPPPVGGRSRNETFLNAPIGIGSKQRCMQDCRQRGNQSHGVDRGFACR
jgi:hypothetical protein